MDYDLYIQVKDGLPINHPSYKANLIDAFGAVPNDWEPFIRVPNPVHENKTITLEHPEPVYRRIDGVWQDVWYTRPKTAEELAAEKAAEEAARRLSVDALRAQWDSHPYVHNFAAWKFNETTMKYEPPFPRPSSPGLYRWCGPDNNWKLAPPFPQDGKKYYFDFDNWVNVEITNV